MMGDGRCWLGTPSSGAAMMTADDDARTRRPRGEGRRAARDVREAPRAPVRAFAFVGLRTLLILQDLLADAYLKG